MFHCFNLAFVDKLESSLVGSPCPWTNHLTPSIRPTRLKNSNITFPRNLAERFIDLFYLEMHQKLLYLKSFANCTYVKWKLLLFIPYKITLLSSPPDHNVFLNVVASSWMYFICLVCLWVVIVAGINKNQTFGPHEPTLRRITIPEIDERAF